MKIPMVLVLTVACMVSTGCVRRTVTVAPAKRVSGSKNQYSGDGKVVEEKVIWIWQDEYRQSR